MLCLPCGYAAPYDASRAHRQWWEKLAMSWTWSPLQQTVAPPTVAAAPNAAAAPAPTAAAVLVGCTS